MLVWQGAPLDALLLDLDDTILDGRTGLAEAQARLAEHLAARLGDVPASSVRRAFGAASRWFWEDDERHRRGRLDLPGARREIVVRTLEALGRPDAELAAEAAARYSELRDASHALFPGARQALARLRERAPALGLVTNGAADAQRAKIERFGLARFFDVIVVEGELGVGKPDGRVFAHALGSLGVSAPAALMAGDNYACDVLGALEAGLHAVWIDRDGASAAPRPPPRPHSTLGSFVALVEALGIP